MGTRHEASAGVAAGRWLCADVDGNCAAHGAKGGNTQGTKSGDRCLPTSGRKERSRSCGSQSGFGHSTSVVPKLPRQATSDHRAVWVPLLPEKTRPPGAGSAAGPDAGVRARGGIKQSESQNQPVVLSPTPIHCSALPVWRTRSAGFGTLAGAASAGLGAGGRARGFAGGA